MPAKNVRIDISLSPILLSWNLLERADQRHSNPPIQKFNHLSPSDQAVRSLHDAPSASAACQHPYQREGGSEILWLKPEMRPAICRKWKWDSGFRFWLPAWADPLLADVCLRLFCLFPSVVPLVPSRRRRHHLRTARSRCWIKRSMGSSSWRALENPSVWGL